MFEVDVKNVTKVRRGGGGGEGGDQLRFGVLILTFEGVADFWYTNR